MSHVLIVAHHERDEAVELARLAADWLTAHGQLPLMPPDDAAELGLEHLAAPAGTDHARAVLVISLGGDGTMLRAVHLLGGAPVPVLGVNVGLLGYLTEVEPPALTAALERFFAGDHGIDTRMMLTAEVIRADGTVEASARALNEASLEKQEAGHTVRMLVHIDGAPFTSYQADGIIVATPTGSTAYSLSARGPVVSPRHRALLFTPVSPHMLFDRSLVLDPDEVVEIEVTGHRAVELAIDGQRITTLTSGDTVRVRRSTCEAHFVRLAPRRFHQILKAKFGLSDR
jgi:NAD+ kinase